MEMPVDAQSIDVTPLFRLFGVKGPVAGLCNANTYEVDVAQPENNWLYPAFRGFEALRRRLVDDGRQTYAFATVGTGAGWDAVGAYHILKPKRIIASDYHPNVIPLAARNIRGNIPDGAAEILTLTGDLCAPLREWNLKADVLYANLPLLPDDPARVLEDMRSSTFVAWERVNAAPEAYRKYRLAMKYLLLNDAVTSLEPGGSVVINLGGRVPVELVREMFDECGYFYEELYTMLKAQTQPEEVLPGFAAAEKEGGVTFDFYRLRAARQGLAGISGFSSAADLKRLLEPYRVSATEAWNLHGKGEHVGHVVQVIRGTRP